MQTQPQAPYYDDFDEQKGYYQILYRPGYAVQARELTQSQSILQKQLERFGTHVFENGSPVVGGESTYDKNVKAIRIESTYNGNPLDLELLNNTNVRGSLSDLEAPVIHAEVIAGQTYVFVVLKGAELFEDGETLQYYDPVALTWNNFANLIDTGACTPSAIYSINEGVFFHNGYFVWVAAQKLVVSTTTSSPSRKVGLRVNTSIINEVQDTSLLDPALGAPNENAPGAHRYQILMTLESIGIDDVTGNDFVELFRVSNGDIEKNVQTPIYSELEKTLARRTYDESGNYTVRPFKITLLNSSEVNDWESRVEPDPSDRSAGSISLNYTTNSMRVGVFDTRESVTSRLKGYVKITGNTLTGVVDTANFEGSGNIVQRPSDIDFSNLEYPVGMNAVEWAANGFVFDISVEEIEKVFTATFASALTNDVRFEAYFHTDSDTSELFFGSMPVASPFTDKHFYEGAIDAKRSENLKIEIDSGKAYIFGQEFETLSKEVVYLPKARTSQQVQNYAIGLSYGNYALCDNYVGYFAYDSLQTVYLCSGTALNGTTLSSTQVGTAKVRDVVRDGSNIRLYLFDFRFTGSNSFENVRSIFASNVYAANIGQCNIAPAGIVNGKARLFEGNSSSLLFPIAQPIIKTVKPNGVLDASYTTRVKYAATFSSGSVTISAGVGRQFLAGTDNYLIIRDSDGVVIPAGSVTLNSGATSATINVSGATYAATVIAPVFLQQAPLATKTLVSNSTFTVLNATATFYDVNRRFYSLRKSDMFRIKSVIDALGTDITHYFDKDDGQRDNHYDHGGIILKAGFAVQSNQYPFVVTFDYFTHNGPGFFAVDSYDDIDYADIPAYRSPTNGSTYALRDVIDFRPRREDDATGSTNMVVYPGGVILPANTGANVMISDYEFYLPRRDKLVLNRNKKFEVIQGVPALSPVSPADDLNAMTLYNLTIPAYSFDPKSVVQKFIENKRYTMRDIGLLEKRIENLEYYTTLSLLEKSTLDTEIKDSNGLTRFKNGILVDSFTGHGVGDVGSIDYKCSVDFTNKFMRAPFVSRNYPLAIVTGESSGYQRSGNDDVGYVATLPFTETPLVRQPLASKIVNLNPYLVIKHIGHIDMNPSSDDWVDTETRPDVSINLEGDRDSWEFILNSVNGLDGNGFGTQWNDWETIWSGESVTSFSDNTFRTGNNVPREDAIAGITGIPNNTLFALGRNTGTVLSSVQTQSRTGVTTSVTPETITETIGDLVTDVTIRPYMRQTDIRWSVKGLRPNRRMYLFFDGVAIENYNANYTSVVPVVTDASGSANGRLRIPAGVFRTGEREFSIIDDPANDRDAATTYASQKFHASGIAITKQNVNISTRVPVVTQEAISETRTVEQITINIDPPLFIDPVAQTFFVPAQQHPNGCFLSSVDVFFKTKSRTGVPVRLEIRPTNNGYPDSNVIIPASVVYKTPAEVNVSENGATATTFAFPFPIYLAPGEYALVLLADSQEYEVFVSEIGKVDLATGGRITTQPYLGSLFKSQNASTWTATQEEDLKMVIRRCSFASSQGQIVLQNTNTNTYPFNLSKFISETISFGDSAPVAWEQLGNSPTNNVIPYAPVMSNKNTEWDNERRVAGVGTLKMRGTIRTSDNAISPLIDLNRQSVFLVRNVIGTSFIGEQTAKSGEALAKYVTRRVNLEEGFNADSMRIWFDAVRPQGTDIRVYVKAVASEDPDLFDDIGYVAVEDTRNGNLYSTSADDWREFVYEIPEGALTYTNSLGNEFTTFNSFAIKIVMLSNNTSRVPKVKNLRGVSLE